MSSAKTLDEKFGRRKIPDIWFRTIANFEHRV